MLKKNTSKLTARQQAFIQECLDNAQLADYIAGVESGEVKP